MFKRLLNLPKQPKQSFFLWGQRQVGKSTLLKQSYADANNIDLLKSEEFRKYTNQPELLRQEIQTSNNKLIIIDEIQKVPSLLNEVHWLIENYKTKFVLCGSSARKLKRGHANLLGGRALRFELHGLILNELKNDFDLTKILNRGYIPNHYIDDNYKLRLRSYVSDYLKEEIAGEGLVRNLPAFSNFLDIAAISDTEPINFSNIARDCSISSPTVKEYFQILTDTLIGSWLPGYTKKPKRRVIASDKFYFSDLGVVNFLAKRGELTQGSELFGKAFENWLCHELLTHSQYTSKFYDLSYWKLASGTEVDFIINDMEFAIEAKSGSKITDNHLKGLRELKNDNPKIKRCIVVCTESKKRKTPDGIEIMPYKDFIDLLWENLF